MLLFASPLAFSQTLEAESISVVPLGSLPDVNADALNSSSQNTDQDPGATSNVNPNEDPNVGIESQDSRLLPMLDVPMSNSAFTSRNFIGLGLSYSNAGVTRGKFKITEDDTLQGKVSESSWGMGLIFDLGWSEEASSSFRMKWGLNRVRVGLTDALRSEYGPDKLEEALNTASLDFLLRKVLPTEDADLWWGGGFAIRYAWSSSTAGGGAERVSKLRYSSAFAPMLSLGTDVVLEQGHQLVVQADWLLLNAYQITVGLRTQL